MKRRRFLQTSLQAGALLGTVAASGMLTASAQNVSPTNFDDPFRQPPLPYALDALGPFLGAEQMDYHYNKHHASYYANLKNLLADKPEAGMKLEEIVVKSEPGPVFNNAAQAWNHAFFWNCMAPAGKGGNVSEKLLNAINRDFGGFDKFKADFIAKSTAVFGSGWGWLTSDKDGKLSILQASNADCPQKHGLKPILVVDVWEHAYYVDYRNGRAKFLAEFLNYVNWNFVNGNY